MKKKREGVITGVVARLLNQGILKNVDNPRIVDVGCGNGDSVEVLRAQGYEAMGCDFGFKGGSHVARLTHEGFLKKIESEPYRLPFADNVFDIAYSDQVIEHVSNIDGFFSEVARILKPGGVSLHYFPSINKLMEPHVGIPFAGRFQTRGYVSFWCRFGALGVPRCRWRERGEEAIIDYLDRHTHYRTNQAIIKTALKYFSDADMDGRLLLSAIPSKRARLLRSVPLGARLFNSVWSSLLITRKA